MIRNPISLAIFAAFKQFLEFPLVVKIISKSFFNPYDSTCLEKILSKEESFEIAVRIELSVVSAIAGRPFLLILLENEFTNSAAKC